MTVKDSQNLEGLLKLQTLLVSSIAQFHQHEVVVVSLSNWVMIDRKALPRDFDPGRYAMD
jgi:hypothetical protein